MLVLSQDPGMRVCIPLGDGRVGFVHGRIEGGRIRLAFDFPKDVKISRTYIDPATTVQVAQPMAIETRGDYAAALAGTVWEGGSK
jgi:sRNA-binding carbon storage regulator CsrA